MSAPAKTPTFVKDEDFTFSGDHIKEWFRFDRIVERYSKRKYHKLGPQLWNDSAVPIDNQTIDAISQDTYDAILKVQGIREASAYYEWDHFWTVPFQEQWRADAIEGLKDYVESKSTGKAVKLLTELAEDKWPQLRAIMMRKFAKTTPRQVKTMENEYIAGLPHSAGSHPFPRGLDMELKLYDLEQHKLMLWLICPEERRESYYYTQDSTLVRVILNHVNSDYMSDINRVLDLHKIELRRTGKDVPADAAAENYDDSWLPDYETIKACLEATYETLRKESSNGKTELPSMALAGHGTEIKGNCWRCGVHGQRMGHAGCTDPTGIHDSAPEHIKEKHRQGRLTDYPTPGSKPKPKGDITSQVCRNYQKGHCRFGQKCRRIHEGGSSGNRGSNVRDLSTAILQSCKSRLENAAKSRGTSRKRDDAASESDDDGRSDLLNLMTSAIGDAGSKKKGKGKKSARNAMMRMCNTQTFPSAAATTSDALRHTHEGESGCGMDWDTVTPGDQGNVVCMGQLHSKLTYGVDTDSSRLVSTNHTIFIPGLLNTSEAARNSVQILSAGATNAVLGIGPGAVQTNDTIDGRPKWIIDPQGILLKKDAHGHDMTCFAQQRMKAMGVRLVQCFNGSQDDVLQCMRTGEVIKLFEENGILVGRRNKRQASDLARVTNIELLIDDIAAKRVSPIVDARIKHYHGASPATTSIRTAAAQLQSARGDLGPAFGIKPPEPPSKPSRASALSEHSIIRSSTRGCPDFKEGDVSSTSGEYKDSRLAIDAAEFDRQRPTEFLWKGTSLLMATTEPDRKFVLLAMNEAKLNKEELARLWHWRLIHHRMSMPVSMYKKDLADGMEVTHCLNEQCPICDGARLRVKSFPRNNLQIKQARDSWEVAFADFYGGQNSMGCRSYDGATGGVIFVCSKSNAWQKYLTRTKGQFPAVLDRFLLWVYTQKHKCRIIKMDTDATNISDEIQQVAAKWECVILPISTSTPQEIAMAEKAVGDMRRDSRAAMLAAPHLPDFCWGLADGFSCYVHYVSESASNPGGMSPYQVIEGRKPDLKMLAIHVFGCPVKFKPAKKSIGAPLNKNDEVAIDGWYVGVLWPKELVLRKIDKKVVAVSRKKLTHFEAIYMLPLHLNPITSRMVSVEPDTTEYGPDYKPKSVQSVQTAHEAKAGTGIEPMYKHGGHQNALEDGYFESSDQGEGTLIREDNVALEKIRNSDLVSAVEDEFKATQIEPALRDRLIEATKAYVKSKGQVEIPRNQLKRKSPASTRVTRSGTEVKTAEQQLNETVQLSSRPIDSVDLPGEERKSDCDEEDASDLRLSSPVPAPTRNQKSVAGEQKKVRFEVEPKKLKLYQRPVGTRVTIDTARFDVPPDGDDDDPPPLYSEGKPSKMFGTIVKKGKGGVMYCKWDIDDTVSRSHWKHLQAVDLTQRPVAVHVLLALIEQHAVMQHEHSDAKKPTPKNFLIALTRHPWRQWVEAYRKEMHSWDENQAYTEVDFKEVPHDATIIPLGELTTIKRDGTFKYRQIGLGNQIRKGVSLLYTFSTTIGAAALRWFHALECACGVKSRGLDAVCGYLQAKARDTIYAYKPSCADYVNMSMEQLAALRKNLLKVAAEGGDKAVTKLYREQQRSDRYKKLWRLDSAIYGVPDAGQCFAMFLQGVMVNKLEMVQCEVEPSIYYKYDYYTVDELLQMPMSKLSREQIEAKPKVVKGYLITCTWTDDLRYFGTEDMMLWFEAGMQKHMKVKLLGETDEFVSVETHHNLDEGTLELKMPVYWEKAIDRFAEYFPGGVKGVKDREVPWKEHVKVVEATADEVEEAQHLPFREICGVLGFGVHMVKVECKVYLALLQQQMQGWSKQHFKLALQLLEYCYYTRHLGVIACKDLDPHGINIVYAYADSSFERPRSRGCSLTMLNCMPVTINSGRHTTTDDSTMKAEITEAFLASTDVIALRNLMAEIGLFQEEPTLLYQDNKPAITVAENKGALHKASRALDIRVYALRNRIEDQAVMLKWVDSLSMLADLGTKILPTRTFKFLRDLVTGYAHARAAGKTVLPSMVTTLSVMMAVQTSKSRKSRL